MMRSPARQRGVVLLFATALLLLVSIAMTLQIPHRARGFHDDDVDEAVAAVYAVAERALDNYVRVAPSGEWPTSLGTLKYATPIPDPLFGTGTGIDLAVGSVTDAGAVAPGDPYPIVVAGASAADADALLEVAGYLGGAASYDAVRNEVTFLLQPAGRERAHRDPAPNDSRSTFAHVTAFDCENCRDFHENNMEFRDSADTAQVILPVQTGTDVDMSAVQLEGASGRINGTLELPGTGVTVTVDQLLSQDAPVNVGGQLTVEGQLCIFDPGAGDIAPPDGC